MGSAIFRSFESQAESRSFLLSVLKVKPIISLVCSPSKVARRTCGIELMTSVDAQAVTLLHSVAFWANLVWHSGVQAQFSSAWRQSSGGPILRCRAPDIAAAASTVHRTSRDSDTACVHIV